MKNRHWLAISAGAMVVSVGVAGCRSNAPPAPKVSSGIHSSRSVLESRLSSEEAGPTSMPPSSSEMTPPSSSQTAPSSASQSKTQAASKPSSSHASSTAPSSAAPSSPAEHQKPAVPIIWFGRPTGGAIYITIDDGWFPNDKVLALMKKDHLPITTFLIKEAAEEHLSFWKQFVADGGVIEDHTVSHPNLTTVSKAEQYQQWKAPMVAYQAWFQQTPIVGRPPYGGYNLSVEQQAKKAGLHALVMWSATMSPQGLQTFNGKPLSAGDIVLLHWDPGVYQELLHVLKVAHQRHLVVRPLLSGIGMTASASAPAASKSPPSSTKASPTKSTTASPSSHSTSSPPSATPSSSKKAPSPSSSQ